MSSNTESQSLGFTPYPEEKIAKEEYMCPAQKEHFADILRAWRDALSQEGSSTVGHLQQEKENYADPIDRAAQDTDFTIELRTRDRERKLIKKIEQSLDQINTNEYGFCEDCGADIGIRRLEARPTATKCIDCKTFAEIKEKQGS